MSGTDQSGLIEQLQAQIEQLQISVTRMGDENAQLKLRVHEEIKWVLSRSPQTTGMGE